MNIQILNSKLARRIDQGTLDRKFGPGVAAAFDRFLALVLAAPNETALYAFAGLRIEKLEGEEGTRSARLNRQFRVVFYIQEELGGNTLVVTDLLDYH